MTDLETMRGLLKRAEIKFTEHTVEEQYIPRPHDEFPSGTARVLTIGTKDGPRNLGYSSSFVDFGFDADGTLLLSGCWE